MQKQRSQIQRKTSLKFEPILIFGIFQSLFSTKWGEVFLCHVCMAAAPGRAVLVLVLNHGARPAGTQRFSWAVPSAVQCCCSPPACKWMRPFWFVSTSFKSYGYLERRSHCSFQLQLPTRPRGSLLFLESISILLMFLFCFDIYVFWVVRTAGWEAMFPPGRKKQQQQQKPKW